MDTNRSLEDFSGGPGDESDGGDEETESDVADIEPVTPTYRWSSTSDICPRCDESVERRWEDGGEFVCGECKEW